MTHKQPFVLGAILLALMGAYYGKLYLRRADPEPVDVRTQIVQGVAVDNVGGIRLYAGEEREAGLMFGRAEDEWALLRPFVHKADATPLKQLYDDLLSLKGDAVADSPDVLEEFGLRNEEALHIEIVGRMDNELAHLLVGKKPDEGGGSFVRRSGEDKVYRVDRDVRGLLGLFDKDDELAPRRWLDLSLTGIERDKIVGLTLQSPGRRIEFAREDGVWKLKQPAAHEIKGGAVDSILGQLVPGRAEDAADVDFLPAYGLEAPTHIARMTLEGGETHVFIVGAAVPDEENRWYACGVDRGRPADEQVYVIGKSIRDAIGRPFGELAEAKLREMAPETVDRVSLIDADHHIMLEREVADWKVVKPAGVAGVNEAAMESLLKEVSTVRMDDVVDDPTETGLDNPARRIIVTRLDGEAFELQVGTAVPGRDEQYHARINSDGAVFAVKLSTLEKMQPPLKELADLKLFAGDVTAVRVHTPEREFDGLPADVADLTAVDVKDAVKVQDSELDAGATWFEATVGGATVRVTVGAMDAGHRPLRLSDRPTIWYVRAPDVGRTLEAQPE